jgi:hypothetical protein
VIPAYHPPRVARLAAWLALLSTLALALGPSLARALGPPRAVLEMAAVCSAGGWRWVALPASAQSDTSAPGKHAAASCPWCPPGGVSVGAVPVSATVSAAAVPWRPLAIADAGLPTLRPAVSAATARGPPPSAGPAFA